MVNVDESFELRYKVGKNEFEVLVDFETYKKFKSKPEEMSVYDVLADHKIYADQKKGEVASAGEITKIFGNKSEEEVLKEILLKGECQIPAAYLKKLRDEKRSQVVNYIVENATNPVTKTKFTPSLIEGAIDKIRYNFDYNKDFEIQAKEVIDILKKQMPISVNKVVLEVTIPPVFLGAFYGKFRSMVRVMIEKYDNLGNLVLRFEIPQSKQDEIIDYIKRNSGNEASYHVVN
jgi:ribosome maturation protein SDO1